MQNTKNILSLTKALIEDSKSQTLDIHRTFTDPGFTIQPETEELNSLISPNGPTLCFYLSKDEACLYLEDTLDNLKQSQPDYYLTCFADPDLQLTHNGQTILITID